MIIRQSLRQSGIFKRRIILVLVFLGILLTVGCAKQEITPAKQPRKTTGEKKTEQKEANEKKANVKETTVAVPDLKDAQVDDARESVESAGLVLKVIREEEGRKVNPDKVESEKQRIGADVSYSKIDQNVTSQNPPAGTVVAIGTSVDVVVRNDELVILMSPDPNNPASAIGPDE